MMKVLILLGSPHADGNTAALAESFARGAESAGQAVELVHLAKLNIGYCRGCNGCRQGSGDCVLQDDMAQLCDKICAAELVVFATPLYFMTISSQLKTCIDRLYAPFHAKRLTGKRTAALLVASGAPVPAAADNIRSTFGVITDLLGWENGGFVWAGGFANDGAIRTAPVMQTAFNLGARLAAKLD